MVGRTLGHYRILEKVGEGGMGVVYRAHDERLDRDVALKVLTSGTLTDEAARRRFRKEALALSKLNHPNVETVHDFDTQEGVDLLVMEYIPGVTVSDMLSHGPLPEKEIARLGAQLADGLAAAHEQGVVHCDLKPGNLRLMPDGRLKVLDFGLAKLAAPAVSPSRPRTTETRSVAGTLPYMAPEQLRGEVADGRSDIYSAGVVLYEMATGRLPFDEKLATALADDILHRPIPPPGRLKPDLSPRLEAVILKCLEKDRNDRYQSARELLVDLRRLTTQQVVTGMPEPRFTRSRLLQLTAGVVLVAAIALAGYAFRHQLWPSSAQPAGRVMLAVLPVENLSRDPEQEYFSEGLTEELIAQLGRLQPERLGVIARTSVIPYKDTKKSIEQIGRELRVDYVLEGSVRRQGDRVRITAQLIQVRDQTHLWADSYDRNRADVFGVQSDVALRVASSLTVKLLPAQKAVLARASTTNPEAHEAYLKGRYYWNKRTEEDYRMGLKYFEQAIGTDPGYALAYSGLADSYVMLGRYSYVPSREAFRNAKAAARKALELDDSLSEAHTSLAHATLYGDWAWSEAEREYTRAIELNPSYSQAHHWYALALFMMARQKEGITQIRRAQELDPLSLIINTNAAWLFYLAGEYDTSIEEFRKALAMDPNFGLARLRLGLSYEQKGMYDEAIREVQIAIRLSGGGSEYTAALAHIYAMAGRRAEAEKTLRELMETLKHRYVPASDVAVVYAGLNDTERALEWLKRAYDEGAAYLVYLRVDPRFARLRSDPRFQDLVRRMNFPD